MNLTPILILEVGGPRYLLEKARRTMGRTGREHKRPTRTAPLDGLPAAQVWSCEKGTQRHVLEGARSGIPRRGVRYSVVKRRSIGSKGETTTGNTREDLGGKASSTTAVLNIGDSASTFQC